MTLRECDDRTPEMLVLVGSPADATVLSVLGAHGLLEVVGGSIDGVRSTLVATGPDPMAVDETLDDLGTPAGRILLPDGDLGGVPDDVAGHGPGPAVELAGLLPRLDALIAESRPAAVLVRGGSGVALAGAQAAVWRGVPVLSLPAPDATRVHAANRAMIVELTAWQATEGGVPFPAWLDLMVHQRLTPFDAAGVIAQPTSRLPPGLSA